jgi:hypothetical protein
MKTSVNDRDHNDRDGVEDDANIAILMIDTAQTNAALLRVAANKTNMSHIGNG